MTNLQTGNFMDLISSVQGGEFEYVDDMPIDQCYPDTEQPRYKNLTAEGVADITATFAVTKGRIWQPIVVREEDELGHKILMGGRRWLAVKLYGEPVIPVLIVKKDIDSALFLQLMENIARKPLDIREEGRSFILLKENGQRQREIAASLNKSEAYIAEAIMMSHMETEPELAFLNKIYDDEVCQDTSTLAVLVRMARKDPIKTKTLVQWAIENDCLNRRWAKSLSVSDLDVSAEQKIADLEERLALEKRPASKTQPLPGMTDDEGYVVGGGDSDFRLDQEQDGVVADAPVATKPKKISEPAPSDQSGEKLSESQLRKKVTQISVLHGGRAGMLLMDIIDKEDGFAWVQYLNDEAPVRVDLAELSVIHVG